MCVLRANGKEFDVDTFLEGSALTPYQVYHRGEREFPSSARNYNCFDTSGLKIEVSHREWSELPEQINDATQFLTKYERELATLVGFSGVDEVWIDFPYELRIDGVKVMAQYDYLPPSLLQLAGKLGIGIAMSLYPAEDSENASGNESG